MKTAFKFFSLILILGLIFGFSAPKSVSAISLPIPVYVLDPSWTAAGGGGVWSSYQGPPDYDYVSPGATDLFDGREAAPIYAGVTIDPTDGIYEDQGLFAFKPGNTPISTFASEPLSYDFVNETGTLPVWVYIELNKGLAGDTMYQFVPTSNPAGWHTEDAATGAHWQVWTNLTDGVPTGPMLSLADIAASDSSKVVSRVYLTMGMGTAYNVSPGVGTKAWVDTVSIGTTTYDFLLNHTWYVSNTGSDSNSGMESSPFLTIQHAIDAAHDGDTINVAAGLYNEVVTVNKSLTLNGAQAGVDTRRGNVAVTSIILAQTGSTSAISIAANDVTIDGFTIQGAGTAGLQTWGINAAAGTSTYGVHITNNTFQNLYEGLHVQGPDTNVAGNMTVDKNMFIDEHPSDPFAQAAGIWMAAAPSYLITIKNNSFSGHDAGDGGDYAAINIDFSTDLVIEDNTSFNDGSFLVLVNCTNVTVSGNTSGNSNLPGFTDNSSIFLALGNDGVTIQNNQLNLGFRGVRLSTAFGTGLNHKIQVLNNTITNMVDAGILVPAGTVDDQVVVHGNQITGNPIGVKNDNSTLIVDASRNWWGDISGPGPVGTGMGDTISTYVDYNPWCGDAACSFLVTWVVPVAPTGTLTSWDQTFSWTDYTGATAFYLEFYNAATDTLINGKWVNAATACVAGNCEIVIPNWALKPNGDYKWRIRSWITDHFTPWSEYMNFTLNIDCYTLATTISNGTIKVNLGQNCLGGYTAGTDVKLTAIPDSGYAFNNWTGDASGKINPVHVIMNANKSVTANLNQVAVLISPSGHVSPWINTFRWNERTGATLYLFEVFNSATNIRIASSWVWASKNCVAGICQFSPSVLIGLADGAYKWRVQDYGAYGNGIRTLFMKFQLP
jgi:hypothetical protein